MKRPAVVIICTSIILIAALVAVLMLSLAHDDATSVMILFTTGIIPTVMSMFAFHSASKANDSAGKAAHNTNGLLHEQMRRADAAERALKRLTQDKRNDHDNETK